ncbi:hypothetical protein C8D87_1021107 [Lentzea atacamensis]|uniref:Uncharacterized protein n=1 Tax=Lentzea atacamensis TaxID=531938 RepID=A0ABX9EEF5_9PSEU|nr:hypothetical protein [Lentzea atacamensis]RAS69029.1 hypothetical protein C8D87_1021107 [Lentzea atacamensis]
MSSSPVPRRTAWLLIAGGFAGLAAGVGFGVTLTTGLVFVGLLGGLAYALGVSGLAERKWIALPAFALGLVAPFLLTFGGHSVLMQRIGHVEHCTITQAEEHPFAKYPSVDYVLACPSGEVELSRDWDDRLAIMEADVLVGSPLRPVFADNARWNLVPVTSVPLAMTLLVPVARALRKAP